MRRALSLIVTAGVALSGCATGQPPQPTTAVYGRAPVYHQPPPQVVYQQAPPQYAYPQAAPQPAAAVRSVPPPPQPTYHANPPAPQPQYADAQHQQIRDTEDCKAWAYQQTGFEGGKDAAKGAVVGGALGALGAAAAGAAIGAVAGGGKGAGKGAAIGAVAGGVGGAAIGGTYNYSKSKEGYEQAFAACMKGRGYAVGR